MSSESQDNVQEQSSGGEELSDALAGSDSEFVTAQEAKPTLNQGLLYLLLVVAIGGGGTYLMYKRQGPATAAAASAQTVQSQQTINNFLTTGPNGIKMMEEMLHNTQKIVQQFLDYPSVPQVPLSDLQTNPFLFSKNDSAPKTDPDAEKKKAEAEKAALMRAAGELHLQSIISGNHRACMINNMLYTEGQQVESFTIEKILPNKVIVRSGTHGFELRMQK
jgi:hypothetical protein